MMRIKELFRGPWFTRKRRVRMPRVSDVEVAELTVPGEKS